VNHTVIWHFLLSSCKLIQISECKKERRRRKEKNAIIMLVIFGSTLRKLDVQDWYSSTLMGE